MMDWQPLVIEEINDPAAIARHQAQDERASQNSAWLQAHWSDLLPQARGKFLVVAGQEAFLSDVLDEALAQARAAHPDDHGALAQYVLPRTGPRIYSPRLVRVEPEHAV